MFAAEPNLSIASFILVRFVFKIVEINLISVISLSMREYRVGRNAVLKIPGQDRLALIVELQKAHRVGLALATSCRDIRRIREEHTRPRSLKNAWLVVGLAMR